MSTDTNSSSSISTCFFGCDLRFVAFESVPGSESKRRNAEV